MKKIQQIIILSVLACLPFLVLASGDHGEQVTVKGEILDMACYVAHGAQGEEHAGCAKACVKGGQPMGLLAADGKVYLLYAGHDDSSAYDAAKEFAGKQVEITGKAAEKAGINGIEVRAVKGI